MTIQELIDELEKRPKDSVVYVSDLGKPGRLSTDIRPYTDLGTNITMLLCIPDSGKKIEE